MSKNRPIEKNDVITNICKEYQDNNIIPAQAFNNPDVKRGLRNQDGTGVIAGVTAIGNVRGYHIIDNERVPADGVLTYRNIDVVDIIDNYDSDFCFKRNKYLCL